MEKGYKVILLGDSGVGKTSICCKKLTGQFSDSNPTIGLANSKISINIDNKTIILNIWDTAGAEQFQSITPLYIKNALCIIIVGSLFDSPSINHILKWKQQAISYTKNIPLIAVINKIDLENPPIAISEINSMLLEHFTNVLFVSAKNGSGIDELFNLAADLAVKTDETIKEQNTLNQHQKRYFCC